MHVAACVAHACLPVTGGRAAAYTGVFLTPLPLRRPHLHPSSWATTSSFGKVCHPLPALPSPALHALAEPLRAHELTTPLPRALQVGIWALPTPTRTSKHPLSQNVMLFRVVPVVSSENLFVKIVAATSQCLAYVWPRAGRCLSGDCFGTCMFFFAFSSLFGVVYLLLWGTVSCVR